MSEYSLRFHWGTSRAQDTYGWTICTLFVDSKRVASCNGGGYDMKGTVFGNFIAAKFAAKLNQLPSDMKEHYGLTFHNPNRKLGEEIVPGTNKTVEEMESEGTSLGLERYQAFYRASSKVPTKVHTVPSINGACGFSSVESILEAIGGKLKYIDETKKDTFYLLTIDD